MAENTLSASNVFLSIFASLIMVCSFIFNFSFLITLLKLRRLNRIDKSNFLLTHLIFSDFLCSFFVLVPSGYGVYNSNSLGFDGCRVQTFFYTLSFNITFLGLLVLTIERFIRYQFPIWHINNFTKRLRYDENDRLIGERKGHKVFLIIAAIWFLSIFTAFIPFFRNYPDIQYFSIQSQCDYVYENFNWWLWYFFWISLTVPFLVGLLFSFLTFRLIFITSHQVKIRKAQYDLDTYGAKKTGKITLIDNIIDGVDITKQPGNRIYYDHIVNPDEEQETHNNDFHVRNQLLAQYKYDTEKSKTITFFIIFTLSYCLVFPVFVIHFYRTYNNSDLTDGYDDPNVVKRSTYTAFAWISYFLLIAKSFVCLVQNKFYRQALYQSANCRGFSGVFDFQKEIKQLTKAFENDKKSSRA